MEKNTVIVGKSFPLSLSLSRKSYNSEEHVIIFKVKLPKAGWEEVMTRSKTRFFERFQSVLEGYLSRRWENGRRCTTLSARS